MNFFKNITLLLFFGMIASPMMCMDSPLGEKHPISFLGIMALHKETKQYAQAQQERNCTLQQHQNMLQQFKSLDVENRKYLPILKQTIIAAVVDQSLSSDVLEAISPNSVATYSRVRTEKSIAKMPLKGILKKSKQPA